MADSWSLDTVLTSGWSQGGMRCERSCRAVTEAASEAAGECEEVLETVCEDVPEEVSDAMRVQNIFI